MRLTPETKRAALRLLIELGLYGLLVFAYIVLILHFFTDVLVGLYKSNAVLYAVLALGLMVFQGLFLEALTTFLIERLEL